MKITIASKRKITNKWIDKLIAFIIKFKTSSDYFHTEMIIGDKWISTNPTVGAMYIHDLKELNDKYDYIDINIHGAKVKKMLTFAEAQIGKKYDWAGIVFSQGINLKLDDKEKWFCSEIVAEMLKIGGVDVPLQSNQYSPEDIYQLVKPLKI